jgi:hypothetical protein
MSNAYRCQRCDADNPPWYLLRHGDAVVTWACDLDLVPVLRDLQRPQDDGSTKVTVQPARFPHHFEV